MNEQPNLPPPGETEEQRDIRINKDTAAFSYVWIMSVLIYAARRESKFVRFHSKQGIVLFLLTIPALLIPVVGKLLMLLLVAGMLLGFIHAAQGQYAEVPIAGDIAKGNFDYKKFMSQIIHAVTAVVDLIRDAIKSHRAANPKPPDPKPPEPTPPAQTSIDSTQKPL